MGAKDEERLEALEQIQMLRSRELELQNQLEEQQKSWAIDRTNVSQQIRLIEKEKQLLEDEKRLAVNERTAAAKKYGTSASLTGGWTEQQGADECCICEANALHEMEAAQKALQDEKARSNGLAKRIEVRRYHKSRPIGFSTAH